MSDVYTQGDGAAPLGVIQACSPVAPSGDADAREAFVGGTAGVTAVAAAIPNADKVTAYCDELAIADGDTLSSGPLTYRLNVSTAQADLTLEDIYVCRVNSSGVSQEELGSVTALGTDISAGGVFTQAITLSAASAHNAGDRIYITVAVANAHLHTSRSLEVLPNQNIDTPFTGGGQTPPAPIVEQDSYRWRNDDGDETAATWIKAANTDITVGSGGDVAFDTAVRIRYLVQNTGDADSASEQWTQYRRVDTGAGFGAWSQITTSSTYVQATTSAFVTEGALTTQQLGSGTFNSGGLSDIDTDGSNTGEAFAGEEEEPEWVIQFISTDWSVGDVVEIQLRRSGNALDTYTNSVSVTTPAGGQEFTQSAPAVVSASAGLARSTATTKAATATAVASIIKDVAVTKAASATATADLSKDTAKTLAATTSNVAAMSPSLVFLQTCAATVAAVAGFSRALTWAQTCAAVASVAASIQKQTSKTFAATATGSASIAKRTGKVLQATTANVAGMTPSLVFLQECAATVSAVAASSLTVTWAQACAAVVSATASVTKHTAKTWSSVTNNVAALTAVGPGGGGDGGGNGPWRAAVRVTRMMGAVSRTLRGGGL